MYRGALLDTNIVIGIVNDTIEAATIDVFSMFYVSTITVMELYALSGMSPKEEQAIEKVMETMIITLPVTARIARTAGLLGRTRRGRKNDLLIAATAIEHGLELCTRNIRDFRNIPCLRTTTL